MADSTSARDRARAGRRLGGVGLVAYLLILALANLGVEPAVRLTAAAGLDQSWSVFAPEPVQHEVVVEADVRYADGRRVLWRPQRRAPVLATVGYRFEVWAHRLARDTDSELWRPAARWIARRAASEGQRAVSVTLRRRWRPVPRPGATGESRVWREFDFSTVAVGR